MRCEGRNTWKTRDSAKSGRQGGSEPSSPTTERLSFHSVYQNLSKLGWDDEVGKLYTKYELEGLMFDVDNNQS